MASSTASRLSTGSAPGKPEADRADVGVRRRAETGGAAAENLGRGGKLDVHFEPDDGLVARNTRRGQAVGEDMVSSHYSVLLGAFSLLFQDAHEFLQRLAIRRLPLHHHEEATGIEEDRVRRRPASAAPDPARPRA